jgi:hypothetical protein
MPDTHRSILAIGHEPDAAEVPTDRRRADWSADVSLSKPALFRETRKSAQQQIDAFLKLSFGYASRAALNAMATLVAGMVTSAIASRSKTCETDARALLLIVPCPILAGRSGRLSGYLFPRGIATRHRRSRSRALSDGGADPPGDLVLIDDTSVSVAIRLVFRCTFGGRSGAQGTCIGGVDVLYP